MTGATAPRHAPQPAPIKKGSVQKGPGSVSCALAAVGILTLTPFLLGLMALPAAAQDWPARPLRFIVPAGPGSSLDVLARVIGERMRETLGQPVLVDNRPAGGGTVGTAAAAQAAPNGHTMVISFNGPLALAPFLYSKLPYVPLRDLTPVIVTSTSPNLLAVNAELPVQSVKELVAFAKANPSRLTYASVGNASSSHLTMELFKSVAGFNAVHSPFNGAPPAATSVAQNETQLVFAAPTALNAHLKSGRIRAIAVTSSQRYVLFPDLPTVSEQGYPKFEAMLWNGILVPAGTPVVLVTRLNAEVNRILAHPESRGRIIAAGLDPAGGTPQAFTSLIQAEAARWEPLIRQLAIRLD